MGSGHVPDPRNGMKRPNQVSGLQFCLEILRCNLAALGGLPDTSPKTNMMVYNRNLLFQGFIFRFRVGFRGCNLWFHSCCSVAHSDLDTQKGVTETWAFPKTVTLWLSLSFSGLPWGWNTEVSRHLLQGSCSFQLWSWLQAQGSRLWQDLCRLARDGWWPATGRLSHHWQFQQRNLAGN